MKKLKLFSTHTHTHTQFLSTLALFLFFSLCFTTFSKAQSKDDISFSMTYETSPFDTCFSPTSIVNAVVYTNRNAKAYLEFSPEVPIQKVTVYDEGTNEWIGDFNVSNSTLLIENLEVDKLYQLYTSNTCGEEAILDVIDTKKEKKSPLPVSGTLFSELANYVNEQSQTPIDEFLAENQNISYIEKLSYFQQHLMQGEPFEKFPREGKFPKSNNAGLRGNCDCTFIVRTVEFVAPGTQVTAVTNSDTRRGNINSLGTCSNNNNWGNPHVQYNNDSEYWWYRGDEGPAKYHQLWSQGEHAGGDSRSTIVNDTDQNNTGISSHYAILQYMLNCTNYANVPEGCACNDKPIRFDWRYDTNVSAFAKKRSGLGSKYGAALSQDLASLIYMDNDGVEVLDAGSAIAQAECGKEINSEFFVNSAELAGSLAVVVAAASGSFPLTPGQITAISNDLQQLIGTPFFDFNECNQESSTSNVLMVDDSGDDLFLQTNVPTSITLSSFSNLGVWGKRGWRSWARIQSSFQINGVVKGGFVDSDHEENHCCTKTVGNWVTASHHDPNRLTEFQGLVGLNFANYFFQEPLAPSGGILIEHEYGYIAERVNDECNFAQINPTNTFADEGDDRNSVLQSKSNYGRFEIHDMMGRFISSGESLNLSKSNVTQFILENQLVQNSGIYVVTYYKENFQESWKLYIK